MQTNNQLKKPYLTLLLISAVVYFFLKWVWPLFSPLIVAFLILLAIEPSLSKWSKRLGMKKKVLAYVFIAFTTIGLVAGLYFGLIPFLEGCDFSWCEELLKEPFMEKVVIYLQENGLGTVATISSSALKIGSKVIFNISAYGLSIFLLANVFGKLKENMQKQKEGILILGISNDILTYLKAYFLTLGKMFLILSTLCVLGLMILGIKNGWLIGILAGFLDMLPIIGIGLVLVPTALWQFIQKDYFAGLGCIGVFVASVVVREVLEPKFLGQAVKLPAIGILVSVFAGLKLFGVSGILKGPIAYLLITTIYRRIQYKEEDAI